jgi:thiol-disulfide isomerase/thioredoxin
MKKIVQLIIVVVVFLLSAFMGVTVYKKLHAKGIIEKQISVMPAFSFTTFNAKLFSNESLADNNDKIIINFFNPECEHCQYMAKSYLKNADKFNDVSLLMITIADSASVSKFNSDYHLDSLHNLILLRDPKFQFEKIFGTSVVPSFFIYKDKKLVKKISGETKIENLLN